MTRWVVFCMRDYGLLRLSLRSFLAMTEKYTLKVNLHYKIAASQIQQNHRTNNHRHTNIANDS